MINCDIVQSGTGVCTSIKYPGLYLSSKSNVRAPS
jgi:hypothetical protein